VSVDLGGRVTVREDVKEVIDGDEIESWECSSFGIQELIKCFFTNLEVFFNLLKFLEESLSGTETETIFGLATVFHDVLHGLINTDEIFGLVGELSLDLL
jgi:hypothetical protein